MEKLSKVYFDFAATTPLDMRVLDVMLPYFTQVFGNSSSIHQYGQAAETALESSRQEISRFLNCQPEEVIFTSCGSESDNLAIRGIALAAWKDRQANHILISPVEHHAVSRTALQLAKVLDFDVELLPVDRFGTVSASSVGSRIRPNTALVSIIYANNEIGSINPISEIGEVCRQAGVPFHSDAVQAGTYLSIDVDELNVDSMSLGAHKFYGPKGVGVLYLRKGIPILPTQTGGGQEYGLRAGTHNIAYIVGMAEALKLAHERKQASSDRLIPLRDYLIGHVLEEIPRSQLTGHPTSRLPNHASFVFEGVDGNSLLMMLDIAGFACSSGSACKTGDPEPSDVLLALGLSPKWALGSLRITLGEGNTSDQIEQFLEVLPHLVEQARKISIRN
jgi:cysteine desulfurase